MKSGADLLSIKIGWDPSLLAGVEQGVATAFQQFMSEAEKNPGVTFIEQSWPSFPAATNCALTVLQMEFLQDFREMCGEVEIYADQLGKPVINELRHSASLDSDVLRIAYAELETGLPEASKPLRELSLPMGAAGLPILGMPLLYTKEGFDLSASSLAGVQLVGKQDQEHKLVYMVKTYLGAPN